MKPLQDHIEMINQQSEQAADERTDQRIQQIETKTTHLERTLFRFVLPLLGFLLGCFIARALETLLVFR